jgi:hypothetical protein
VGGCSRRFALSSMSRCRFCAAHLRRHAKVRHGKPPDKSLIFPGSPREPPAFICLFERTQAFAAQRQPRRSASQTITGALHDRKPKCTESKSP